jgi:hypothetical protein
MANGCDVTKSDVTGIDATGIRRPKVGDYPWRVQTSLPLQVNVKGITRAYN